MSHGESAPRNWLDLMTRAATLFLIVACIATVLALPLVIADHHLRERVRTTDVCDDHGGAKDYQVITEDGAMFIHFVCTDGQVLPEENNHE